MTATVHVLSEYLAAKGTPTPLPDDTGDSAEMIAAVAGIKAAIDLGLIGMTLDEIRVLACQPKPLGRSMFGDRDWARKIDNARTWCDGYDPDGFDWRTAVRDAMASPP